jgi:ABC-type transport system substrate-binding protein
MRREKWFALVLVLSLVTSLSDVTESEIVTPDIGDLVLRTNGAGVRPDLGLFIAQYLRDIGFDVEVKIQEWITFSGVLCCSSTFDLGILEFNAGYYAFGNNRYPRYITGSSPDMRALYTENGSMNIFNLNNDIPYNNISEEMQQTGISITNFEERQQHYYDWQELMLDKILPFLPLYSVTAYKILWSNTLGYNASWGLSNSLPYMSYDGLHAGQTNITHFNFADTNWYTLNPLFVTDSFSALVSDLIMEPIIQFSPEFVPTTTGLVNNWTKIDDNHYKFVLRDNLLWNPSYYVTERSASSVPLSLIPEEELMIGLKSGEFSNGTNQQIRAKDAVFTYLLWSNPNVSISSDNYEWISNIYEDPIDDLAFHIHIDANPETTEIEPYMDFWSRLPLKILPEFFLNSTSTNVTYTSGGVKCTGLYSEIVETPQWQNFSASAFGNGKFMMDHYTKNLLSVFSKNPNWFGVGAIDGSASMDIFVDKINIKVIPDQNQELSQFESGHLDWLDLTDYYRSPLNSFLTNSSLKVNPVNIPSMSVLFFNLDSPLIGGSNNYEYLEAESKENYTRGVAFRKAICYAIDRVEMNLVIYDYSSQITHSVLFPFIEDYYFKEIMKYDYDLDSAFEWLEALGYELYTTYRDSYMEIIAVIVISVILGSGALVTLIYYLKEIILSISKRR